VEVNPIAFWTHHQDESGPVEEHTILPTPDHVDRGCRGVGFIVEEFGIEGRGHYHKQPVLATETGHKLTIRGYCHPLHRLLDSSYI